MELEFAHDIRAVAFGGPNADAQRASDFLIPLALHQELDDRTFARAQITRGHRYLAVARAPLQVALQNHFGHPTGAERLTLATSAYGRHQTFCVNRFDQVPKADRHN